MTIRTKLFAAAIGSMIAISPAAAQSATDYNIYTLQGYTANGGSIAGKVAVGGNATFSSTSVATGSTNGQTTLAVGGNLTANQGSLNTGNAVVGGTASTGYGYANNGTITTGTSPLNFTAENNRLTNLSQTLSTYATTGTTSNYYNSLTLTGTSDTLNVFTINGADLDNAYSISFNAPTGSQILVNISGVTDQFKQTINLNGIAASMVLFNFYQANSLTISNQTFYGSILAANAAVNFTNGQLNGTLIAGSLTTGSVGINSAPYQGTLMSSSTSAVPEPMSWVMMIGGFGGLGVMLRRNRARRRSAVGQPQL